MPLNKKKTPVSEAARDCTQGVLAFCRDVESTLRQLAVDPGDHRLALSLFASAMGAAIVRGAGFKTTESERLKSLIDSELESKWSSQSVDVRYAKGAMQDADLAYSQVKEQWSQVRTAAAFAEIYVSSLQIDKGSAEKLLTLIAPMCAHRLVSEIYRLTELRTHRAIQWALVATLVTLCQLSSVAGPRGTVPDSSGGADASPSDVNSPSRSGFA